MKPAHLVLVCCALSLGAAAWAKLPPPSPEAKAKAEEAAAKAKWGDKVAAYQLCQAQNKVAADYYAHAKQQGESTQPPVATPACVDPGPFAYAPPEAAPAPSADKK
uniref:Uncharacterized protein n=1 Tax=mine drainage metagenome TaxID=410659 RepID=E6PMH7_9ZZZZ